jgi:hypothetical protein
MQSSKWFLPGFAASLGVVMFVAAWSGDQKGVAIWSLGLMLAFALLVLLGGRSETIRGLRGDGRDERFRKIDVEATAVSGIAIITATIIGFVVELARGHSGNPYAWLGAIAGLAYLIAVAVLRARG